MYPSFDDMLNRRLASVTLSEDKERITFAFEDGGERAFGVEGDCCSSSWIEHLEMPPDLAGATLLSVEDGGGVDKTDDDALNPKGEYGREHECLQVYQTTFRTNRGDVTLEYRNSSNGYYGGYLVEVRQ